MPFCIVMATNIQYCSTSLLLDGLLMALEPMGLAVMPLVALLEELELLLANGTFLSMGSAMLLLLELLLITIG